jgi:hypothetical protein
MIMKKYSYLLVSVALLLSCKKEKGNDPLPAISNVPEIELSSTSSTSINQFDDLTLTVKYTDGNGDLGESDANINSIFVTDNRDVTIVHKFHLQPLAPLGQDVAIQGNLKIKIENVILLDQSNTSENASFSVYIIDRAGNKSNIVTSPSVRISK